MIIERGSLLYHIIQGPLGKMSLRYQGGKANEIEMREEEIAGVSYIKLLV